MIIHSSAKIRSQLVLQEPAQFEIYFAERVGVGGVHVCMYVCMYQVSPGISKQVQAHLAKWNGVQFNSPTVQFSSVHC